MAVAGYLLLAVASADGLYHESQDVSPHPVALEIRYLRDISSKQLVDATEDQWRKLGFTAPQTQAWLKQLQQILPDVATGDRLVYVSDGQRGEFSLVANNRRNVR